MSVPGPRLLGLNDLGGVAVDRQVVAADRDLWHVEDHHGRWPHVPGLVEHLVKAQAVPTKPAQLGGAPADTGLKFHHGPDIAVGGGLQQFEGGRVQELVHDHGRQRSTLVVGGQVANHVAAAQGHVLRQPGERAPRHRQAHAPRFP